MEIQRIYEVTATPLHGTENWSQQGTEGASLSEEQKSTEIPEKLLDRAIRGFDRDNQVRVAADFFYVLRQTYQRRKYGEITFYI